MKHKDVIYFRHYNGVIHAREENRGTSLCGLAPGVEYPAENNFRSRRRDINKMEVVEEEPTCRTCRRIIGLELKEPMPTVTIRLSKKRLELYRAAAKKDRQTLVRWIRLQCDRREAELHIDELL